MIIHPTPQSVKHYEEQGRIHYPPRTFFEKFLIIVSEIFGVFHRRTVDKLSVFVEARTVARAVPRMLGFIPFQRAPEMRTSLFGKIEKIQHGFAEIDKELFFHNGTAG